MGGRNDGRMGGWAVGWLWGVLARDAESRITALSAEPPNRPTGGFGFGGQMSDGATATIIMSTNAISRLRLSTDGPREPDHSRRHETDDT